MIHNKSQINDSYKVMDFLTLQIIRQLSISVRHTYAFLNAHIFLQEANFCLIFWSTITSQKQ